MFEVEVDKTKTMEEDMGGERNPLRLIYEIPMSHYLVIITGLWKHHQ